MYRSVAVCEKAAALEKKKNSLLFYLTQQVQAAVLHQWRTVFKQKVNGVAAFKQKARRLVGRCCFLHSDQNFSSTTRPKA